MTNGDIYTGDWRDGVPQGHGEFDYGGVKEGERYIGQYDKGFRTGYGTYYYSDGKSFVGTYLNDQREGPGVMYFPDGLRREGVWMEDKLRGEVGRYSDTETVMEVWLKDGIYTGGTINGVPQGKGTILYFDEVPYTKNYTGEWLDGQKEGFGKMFWKDGDRYRGDWKNDLPRGKGEYQWSNGNKFVGQFKNGLPSGEGVYETKSGDIFVGNLKNGLPTGRGEFVYGEGKKKWDKYIGQFRNGMFHGNGTYYFSDGSRYSGEFHSGLKDGKGVILYRSGETREGNWMDDKLSGIVMFHQVDGTVKEEIWDDEDHQEENLVKMGNMDNFHSLLGEIKSPPPRPLLSDELLPQTRKDSLRGG